MHCVVALAVAMAAVCPVLCAAKSVVIFHVVLAAVSRYGCEKRCDFSSGFDVNRVHSVFCTVKEIDPN